jgi:hypothetical protein
LHRAGQRVRQLGRTCAAAQQPACSAPVSRYISTWLLHAAYVSIRQHTSAYGAGVPVHIHLAPACSTRQHTSAYVSIRQHTSAYVSIRRRCPGTYPLGSCMQHTSAYVSIRRRCPGTYPLGSCMQHTSAYVSIRQHTSAYGAGVPVHTHLAPACRDVSMSASAYVSIRQHTSAYVSIRQHTSAHVRIRQDTSGYVSIRDVSTCMQRREHQRAIRDGRQHT